MFVSRMIGSSNYATLNKSGKTSFNIQIISSVLIRMSSTFANGIRDQPFSNYKMILPSVISDK